MDAVRFIEERNRMCAMYAPRRCEGCPADNYGGEGVACIMVDKIDEKRLVPIVESWAAAHPRKTRQSVFLEQWPEARIESDGISSICPAVLSKAYRMYSGDKCPNTITPKTCADCRREFWGQEVE